MSCSTHARFTPARNGNGNRAITCGFNAGHSHFARRHDCGPNVLRSGAVHEYPIVCEQPKTITIDRVLSVAGLDNALFLVGDVEGFRMNRNYMLSMPGDAINAVSGNFPTYLILKDGNLHTLGFSTSNIESFLRRNDHMFSRDGISRNRELDLLDTPVFAPQDRNVEDQTNFCRPERFPVETIISNSTLNDASTTVRIDVYECGQLVPGATEIWYESAVLNSNI